MAIPRQRVDSRSPADSISRRGILQGLIAGASGLSLPGVLKLKAEAAALNNNERTALILVFLHGGASHLETYDPKPLAPVEYRGPFNTIPTTVPGLNICELLPRHAEIAHKYTILRSMVHSGFCHGIGQQQMFTGHEIRQFDPKPAHPDFLCVSNRVRGTKDRVLPNYVGVPPIPYLGSAYLGPSYEAFAVNDDPNHAGFSVANVGVTDRAKSARLESRISLRRQLDGIKTNLDLAEGMTSMETFERMAWEMLTRPEAERAFNLQQEDAKLRDRYGRNTWGQQCLLARRLVEAGVDLVTVTLLGPICGRVHNWDDHAVNHHCFDAMKSRAGYFDQAVSTLIEDVYERGLDKRVMVLVTGEFGRTPKISYAKDSASGVMQPGRDHWPAATSMLFAGGGLRTGQVIGGTDRRGEQVIERRIGPGDFLATIYQHLGIDSSRIAFADFTGRPIPIPVEGRAIPELVA
ncbi:MAG: DUF1501 domain-containing protein [Planctomycetaceae bacterium]